MTKLAILSAYERNRFDEQPKFNADERSLYFSLTDDNLDLLKGFRSPTTKIGFVLQLGYFKSNAKFYLSDQFRKPDIDFVAKILGLEHENIDFNTYQKKICIDHQKKIFSLLGWQPFNKKQLTKIEEYALWLAQRQLSPKQIFLSIIDLCWKNKIEVPSYNTMSIIITNAYNHFENCLICVLSNQLNEDHRTKLDDLIYVSKENKTHRSKITLLKQFDHSTRPMDIQNNIENFIIFKDYFNTFKKIIDSLQLSDQATEYFSTWLQKSTSFQLKSLSDKNKLYLHLLCYIKHQYYYRHDLLVDVFLKSTHSAINLAKNKLNDFEKKSRVERNKAIKALSSSNKNSRELLEKITTIVKNTALSETEKITIIEDFLDSYNAQEFLKKENIQQFEKSLDKISNNQTYFDTLESVSIKLQRQVSEIIRYLEFNSDTSSIELVAGINYFKLSNGDLDKQPPTDFLMPSERASLFKENKLRISFYKILLFSHISDAIKSGKLNLLYSYKYKSIHEYLIDKKTWESQREDLIEKAGMNDFKDFQFVIDKLKTQSELKYKVTNDRFLTEENIYLKLNNENKIIIHTPKSDSDDKEFISSLLSQSGYVPILQVLTDINNVSHYTDSFKHFSNKHKKITPKPATIFAGLIGIGCNIGINRIANISVGISEDILKNTVNWCFSLKNIQDATNKIINVSNKLFISNAYKHSPEEVHTGSDGQKINVPVNSLHSNYSYKYFGKSKGVSIYTFLDERQLLFHSTVISSSEREAAYVIDGLQQNEVVKSTIHSTDTHGFTETVFAITHFINTAFAPRIKNIGDQNIYSFSHRQTYEKRGYKILPSRSINLKLIRNNWDDILRFMATVKLKHTPASQLLKRLSSYAKDNPLYQALKEFGRITKSIFILTYLDDVELRQRIEKQLNKVELSNKFSKAVFFANNRELRCSTKETQEIAAACKGLIQNAIILWNYLFLSQLLTNNIDPKEQIHMLGSIKRGSIITWHHINLHGEYDFTKHAINDTNFDLEKILAFKIVE